MSNLPLFMRSRSQILSTSAPIHGVGAGVGAAIAPEIDAATKEPRSAIYKPREGQGGQGSNNAEGRSYFEYTSSFPVGFRQRRVQRWTRPIPCPVRPNHSDGSHRSVQPASAPDPIRRGIPFSRAHCRLGVSSRRYARKHSRNRLSRRCLLGCFARFRRFQKVPRLVG